jgi:hypothetical protein
MAIRFETGADVTKKGAVTKNSVVTENHNPHVTKSRGRPKTANPKTVAERVRQHRARKRQGKEGT